MTFPKILNEDYLSVTGKSLAQSGSAAAARTTLGATTIGGEVLMAANDTAVRTLLNVVAKGDQTLNIIDYGVTQGTAGDQTAAIKAALDAHPGKAFYFPDGDYRLDSQLNITANNSLILGPGARIYAGASMTTLINYDNGAGPTDISNWSASKFIIGDGGVLDGNLLAANVLRVAKVFRFTVQGLIIRDGVHRGILADTYGAEFKGYNLRLENTGTTNVSDNIGIDITMNDASFVNVGLQNWTTGVYDNGPGNDWINVHPYIGGTPQLTARYPTSVGFLLGACSATQIHCYADTYRYSWRTTTGTYSRVRMIAPEVFCNNDANNVTNTIAAANPGTVFDFGATSSSITVTGGLFVGHPTTKHTFVNGNPTTAGLHIDSSVVYNTTEYAGDLLGGLAYPDQYVGVTTTQTLTNKTLTYPFLDLPHVNAITDTNGNVTLSTGAAAAAKNFITVSNAANGTAPKFLAWGPDDAAVGLDLDTSGGGPVRNNGNPVGVKVAVPTTATSTGVPGQFAVDSTHIYVCLATNSWVRSTAATW